MLLPLEFVCIKTRGSSHDLGFFFSFLKRSPNLNKAAEREGLHAGGYPATCRRQTQAITRCTSGLVDIWLVFFVLLFFFFGSTPIHHSSFFFAQSIKRSTTS